MCSYTAQLTGAEIKSYNKRAIQKLFLIRRMEIFMRMMIHNSIFDISLGGKASLAHTDPYIHTVSITYDMESNNEVTTHSHNMQTPHTHHTAREKFHISDFDNGTMLYVLRLCSIAIKGLPKM